MAADLDGHHVALDELAEVDAGVEALRDQVGAAVAFGADVEHHIGVVAGELRELGPHDGCNRHRRRDEADRAGRLRTQSADVADCRRDPFERGTKLCEQALSRVRRRDAAGRAREEAQSQTLLERAYRVADRRSADAELESGIREAPLVRHHRERGEHGEIVPRYW